MNGIDDYMSTERPAGGLVYLPIYCAVAPGSVLHAKEMLGDISNSGLAVQAH